MPVSTKNDLLAAWVRWTGDETREARHRIRLLSEAGLLPERADRLTYDDVARGLLGFLVSDTHKDAPREVRSFSAFVCGAASADDASVPFIDLTLLDAISAALRPPFRLMSLTIAITTRTATLDVTRGWIDPAPRGIDAQYSFHDPYLDRSQRRLFPPIVSKTIYFDLIGKLLSELNLETKAAEAPPSNGLRCDEQAAKPAPSRTEQLTHPRNARQSRKRGGLPSKTSMER